MTLLRSRCAALLTAGSCFSSMSTGPSQDYNGKSKSHAMPPQFVSLAAETLLICMCVASSCGDACAAAGCSGRKDNSLWHFGRLTGWQRSRPIRVCLCLLAPHLNSMLLVVVGMYALSPMLLSVCGKDGALVGDADHAATHADFLHCWCGTYQFCGIDSLT